MSTGQKNDSTCATPPGTFSIFSGVNPIANNEPKNSAAMIKVNQVA